MILRKREKIWRRIISTGISRKSLLPRVHEERSEEKKEKKNKNEKKFLSFFLSFFFTIKSINGRSQRITHPHQSFQLLATVFNKVFVKFDCSFFKKTDNCRSTKSKESHFIKPFNVCSARAIVHVKFLPSFPHSHFLGKDTNLVIMIEPTSIAPTRM